MANILSRTASGMADWVNARAPGLMRTSSTSPCTRTTERKVRKTSCAFTSRPR